MAQARAGASLARKETQSPQPNSRLGGAIRKLSKKVNTRSKHTSALHVVTILSAEFGYELSLFLRYDNQGDAYDDEKGREPR